MSFTLPGTELKPCARPLELYIAWAMKFQVPPLWKIAHELDLNYLNSHTILF